MSVIPLVYLIKKNIFVLPFAMKTFDIVTYERYYDQCISETFFKINLNLKFCIEVKRLLLQHQMHTELENV